MKITLLRNLQLKSVFKNTEEYVRKVVFARIINEIEIDYFYTRLEGNQKEEINFDCSPKEYSLLTSEDLMEFVEKAVNSRDDLELLLIDDIWKDLAIKQQENTTYIYEVDPYFAKYVANQPKFLQRLLTENPRRVYVDRKEIDEYVSKETGNFSFDTKKTQENFMPNLYSCFATTVSTNKKFREELKQLQLPPQCSEDNGDSEDNENSGNGLAILLYVINEDGQKHIKRMEIKRSSFYVLPPQARQAVSDTKNDANRVVNNMEESDELSLEYAKFLSLQSPAVSPDAIAGQYQSNNVNQEVAKQVSINVLRRESAVSATGNNSSGASGTLAAGGMIEETVAPQSGKQPIYISANRGNKSLYREAKVVSATQAVSAASQPVVPVISLFGPSNASCAGNEPRSGGASTGSLPFNPYSPLSINSFFNATPTASGAGNGNVDRSQSGEDVVMGDTSQYSTFQ